MGRSRDTAEDDLQPEKTKRAETWNEVADHPVRALVLHPDVTSGPNRGEGSLRAPESRLAEAEGLARAIDLEIVHREVMRITKPTPSRLLGSGQAERFADLIKAMEIEVAVVDAALTPVQQRNLERAWHCKVIDRTGLILEIFGARARTHEGRLQVDLAALTYQRSRLVRSWTHLERQRGGAGFMGGPGESQIELDRRIIDDKIVKLKRQLDEVKRTRELHRSARRKVPYPIVALVGYTNAGKSTLFNRLTDSDVFAKDLLFATLDPTMRRLKLRSGRQIILSDTVGFISDLPTQLVAAFRATLEEVLEADIILHVRDIAHPDTEAQRVDVETVLSDLGVGPEQGTDYIVEVLNKIDLLPDEDRERALNIAARDDSVIAVSALKGTGSDDLLALLDRRLNALRMTLRVDVSLSDGATLAWLYEHGEVLEREDDESEAHLVVGLDEAELARFERRQADLTA
ncbi:MAG: GTPase HflX [Alphaproteobacteria bacterium]|nr:GTPase HflX [Alphaproteobacteria bacterium]MBU0797055.1 GTPase HflX [Alphaproteobacteria bacterium]MBU0887863.1 GTPase HflX [Alphaproteobacteria bacterium]MBU1814914.1 GTPase HflX [Alphaproteobacteria bacterium]